MAKKNTRPAMHQACESTEDHPGHNWRPEDAQWPESVFWRCRGYDRAKAEQAAINTQRAIRNIAKRTKDSRARAKRARKAREAFRASQQ